MKNLKKLNIKNYISEKGTNFDIELSYEVFGKPLGKAPIVLVNHALTGNSTVSGKNGWWSSVIGNEKLIDTNDYTVIAFNFPGNGYDGFIIENYEDLILRDIAKIFIIGLEKLQIEELYAIIGGSIGGGLVWEMAALSPNIAKNYIPIASDWKSSDWLLANTRLQKQILNNSSNPVHDARIHAMLCYRSPLSFQKKFDRSLSDNNDIFNVESWLLHHGKKLQQRFQLSSYKLMNHLLSKIDITRGSKIKFEDIVSRVKGNILIVSVDSDLFFTDYQNRDTFYKACRIKDNIFFKTIKSVHGHDAFLIEHDQLNVLLSSVFSRKKVLDLDF
jgi:homoserine O-acetyltransferase|tara:strand:- start:1753 stop:2742 length:990 start_codon:yes stop_codon:yes gene_type:complete